MNIFSILWNRGKISKALIQIYNSCESVAKYLTKVQKELETISKVSKNLTDIIKFLNSLMAIIGKILTVLGTKVPTVASYELLIANIDEEIDILDNI
jgi:hypothetical protein